MAASLFENETSDEILSSINLLKDKMEDLEIRIGGVLKMQQDSEKHLESLREELDTELPPPDDLFEKSEDIQLPEDHQSVEELKKAIKLMEESQLSWLETTKGMAKSVKDGKGDETFKNIEMHLSARIEYLTTAKKLIEGPLVEEPPPPPVEEEKPEEKVEKKVAKKGKGKKKKK